MAERIERRRTKGWTMPRGAIYVGRPTIYGNPYRVGDPHPIHGWPMSDTEAVALYRVWFPQHLDLDALATALTGHDLACWCDLSAPCHADVLLEFLNLIDPSTTPKETV